MLDQDNGGIIRDLSPEGLSLHALRPLRVGQEVVLRFDLLAPRLRVEAVGCVVWADLAGQAGVEFLDAPATLRRSLRDWILTRTLATAEENTRDLIFAGPGATRETCQLTFSENPRPAIVLKSDPVVAAIEPPIAISAREPSPQAVPNEFHITWWFVDSLIVVSAVLLFSVIALTMIRTSPDWPLTIAVLFAAAGLFTALYWFLFVFWTGATFGERLVRLEGSVDDLRSPRDDQPRFR